MLGKKREQSNRLREDWLWGGGGGGGVVVGVGNPINGKEHSPFISRRHRSPDAARKGPEGENPGSHVERVALGGVAGKERLGKISPNCISSLQDQGREQGFKKVMT